MDSTIGAESLDSVKLRQGYRKPFARILYGLLDWVEPHLSHGGIVKNCPELELLKKWRMRETFSTPNWDSGPSPEWEEAMNALHGGNKAEARRLYAMANPEAAQ